MRRGAWEAWHLVVGLAVGALFVFAGVRLVGVDQADGVPDGTALVEVAHGLGWMSIALGVFCAGSLILRGLSPGND